MNPKVLKGESGTMLHFYPSSQKEHSKKGWLQVKYLKSYETLSAMLLTRQDLELLSNFFFFNVWLKSFLADNKF